MSTKVRRNSRIKYPCLEGSVPMQQFKFFDGTDHLYTREDFLNAITGNMVMIAGTGQTDLPFDEAGIKITALFGPTQQRRKHLPLESKKNWQAYLAGFSEKKLTIHYHKHKLNYIQKLLHTHVANKKNTRTKN